MKNFVLFFFLLFTFNLFAQQDTLSFDNFYLTFQNNELNVFDNSSGIIYRKKFINPSPYASDLNDDNSDEYLVLDSTVNKGMPWFTLYIYNTTDKFSFIDSIVSGTTEPYETTSGDLGGTIIVSGNTDFEQFNNGNNNYFIPINCWRYEDSAIFLVNDEVYNVFINENESIINYLDDYFNDNPKNCTGTDTIKAAIAAAYVNYINAGEKSVASQFLKNYYLCDDLPKFKQKLNELIKGDE
ncbi:MAG: hypothetical protein WAM24_16245 [Ignavibacteriaceae bacterium]